MFKVKNKTPERFQWHRSGVSIFNFEHISHPFLLSFSIVDIELGYDCLLVAFCY